MAKSANKPVHEIRYGQVKAVIWKNQTTHGYMFNVTFVRIYKEGDDWKESSSFGTDDLLVLAKAADHAHSWIHTERSRPADGE